MKYLHTSIVCIIAMFCLSCNNESSTVSEKEKTDTPVVSNPVTDTNTSIPAKDTTTPTAPVTEKSVETGEGEFRLNGTEPFWGMEITKQFFHFTSAVPGFEQHNAQAVKAEISEDGKVWTYHTPMRAVEMKVRLEKGKCSDGMSDKVYSYKATVEIKRVKDAAFTTFTGCGEVKKRE